MAELIGQFKPVPAPPAEEIAKILGKELPKVLWLGSLLPRLLTTPNGSQRLPTAPYDYKHTLLLASNDSH